MILWLLITLKEALIAMKNKDAPLALRIQLEYETLPLLVRSRGSNRTSERLYRLRQHVIHLSNIVTASNMIDSKKLNTNGNTYAKNIVEKEKRRLWLT